MLICNDISWTIYLERCTTFFLKWHAEHLGMSSSLIVVQIESMRPWLTNRIIDWKFIWPSHRLHFRRDCCASVKLSVFLPSWWIFILYALNLDMPLIELYMGRPLLALHFVANLNPPKNKWASSFSACNISPICPVCYATCWMQIIKMYKPGIWRTCSMIS